MKYSIWPPLRLPTSSTPTVILLIAVDYSTAHSLGYLVAGLNKKGSQFHHCLPLFRKNLFFKESPKKGRAIAQAVSRRFPTAAARVQTRVWSCGIL
jgi:hypothetical protein